MQNKGEDKQNSKHVRNGRHASRAHIYIHAFIYNGTMKTVEYTRRLPMPTAVKILNAASEIKT